MATIMMNGHAQSLNASEVCESSLANGSNRINSTETLNHVNRRLTNIYQPQTSIASTSTSLNASSLLRSGRTESNNRMFQVRRTFLLIVTFDVIFMVLLWIIYNQILNYTIVDAYEREIAHYSIQTSLFDVVALSGLRFILLMLPYAILRWSHWVFVAFTTLGSTGFIIAKTLVFTITRSDKGFTDYIILIASFILAWIEIWFFDYRVIPHERRLREALTQGDRRPLLGSNGSGSNSPNPSYHSITIPSEQRQSFYSPVHSASGSDVDESREGQFRNVRSDSNLSRSLLGTPVSVNDFNNDEDYENQADDMIEHVWHMFKDTDSWTTEAKSSDGNNVVIAKNYPKWGKVFRLTSVIPGSRDDLVQMLFDRQEDMPKWSPTVNDCRILEVVNSDVYITYQMTNEQAQGIVAKRDFVNLTVRRFIDDVAILGAQACHHVQMPPKDNCVRAENGPTAYILEKLDETNCKFTWLLNVDLKGWLPQYLINSSLANVQLSLVDSLRNHLTKTNDMTSSFSSSSGDGTT